MRTTIDYTSSYLTAPESYAMTLVKQGFTGEQYYAQASGSQPAEYVQAVLFELAQLPTTAEYYS